ncbi:hypothetical protein OPQ81_005220 [Rhizoctonia solani]|nr:hypothetical protein OPQ81_005220 [Rhizoctonia solani]
MQVSLPSGLYKIFTETPNGKLYAGVRADSSPDVAGGFPVIAGPESNAAVIELQNIEGLKYNFLLWHHGGLSLGYKVNQFEQGSELIAVPERQYGEWMLAYGRSSPERFRIITPQSHLGWAVQEEAAGGAPIALRTPEPEGGEIVDWGFEFQGSA